MNIQLNYTYHVNVLHVQWFHSGDRQMIYTMIISLLIEKLFYLLISQSFSFPIVSELMDTFVKFPTLFPKGGAFDSLFCPEERVFVHNDCPGRRVLLPSSRLPGGGGGVALKLIPVLEGNESPVFVDVCGCVAAVAHRNFYSEV